MLVWSFEGGVEERASIDAEVIFVFAYRLCRITHILFNLEYDTGKDGLEGRACYR